MQKTLYNSRIFHYKCLQAKSCIGEFDFDLFWMESKKYFKYSIMSDFFYAKHVLNSLRGKFFLLFWELVSYSSIKKSCSVLISQIIFLFPTDILKRNKKKIHGIWGTNENSYAKLIPFSPTFHNIYWNIRKA